MDRTTIRVSSVSRHPARVSCQESPSRDTSTPLVTPPDPQTPARFAERIAHKARYSQDGAVPSLGRLAHRSLAIRLPYPFDVEAARASLPRTNPNVVWRGLARSGSPEPRGSRPGDRFPERTQSREPMSAREKTKPISSRGRSRETNPAPRRPAAPRRAERISGSPASLLADEPPWCSARSFETQVAHDPEDQDFRKVAFMAS